MDHSALTRYIHFAVLHELWMHTTKYTSGKIVTHKANPQSQSNPIKKTTFSRMDSFNAVMVLRSS